MDISGEMTGDKWIEQRKKQQEIEDSIMNAPRQLATLDQKIIILEQRLLQIEQRLTAARI